MHVDTDVFSLLPRKECKQLIQILFFSLILILVVMYRVTITTPYTFFLQVFGITH